MKQYLGLFLLAGFAIACNNNATPTNSEDSTSASTDMSVNSASTDSMNQQGTQQSAPVTTDSAATQFLRKAADGGLAEVAGGQVAQEKAMDAGVKRFGEMMVHDHTGANAEVKRLAAERQIELPAAPGEEHQTKLDKTKQQSGKAFDKAYMDMMVADHQKTIALFEKASKETTDEAVKTFATQTLPTLKMHLDSAKAIRGKIR